MSAGAQPRNDTEAVMAEVRSGDGSRSRARVVADAALPDSAPGAARARAALAGARGDGADRLAEDGLEALGSAYVDRSGRVDDSTDLKLEVARSLDEPLDRGRALSRVLQDRLRMYEWLYEDIALRFDPPLPGDGPGGEDEGGDGDDGGAAQGGGGR